jgi:PAS domain S-box-containing protein
MDPRTSGIPDRPSGEAVLTCDVVGRILEATPSACDLTGYTVDELRSLTLGDLGFTTVAVEATQMLARLRDESVLSVPTDLCRKDGRSRPVRLRVSRDPNPGAARTVVRLRHRRRAAELIDEDEDFARAALQATESLLAVLDAEGRILFLSRTLEEFLGKSFSQVRGQRYQDLIAASGQDADAFSAILKHAPLPAAGESEWVVPGGRRKRIAWSLRPLEVRRGPTGTRLLTGIDITALRDLTLRHNHEIALVGSCGDALFSKSLDGIVTSWNPAAERLYGYAAHEIIGRPVSLLVPSDRRSETDRLLQRVSGGERIRNYDTVRIRKNGTPVEVSLTLDAIRSPEGNVTGVVVIARDASDQWRLEQTLQESERHLKHLLNEMPLALWATDRELLVTYCAGRLCGVEPLSPHGSFVGRPVDNLFPRENAAIALHRAALQGRSGRLTLEIQGHIFNAHVVPLTDSDGHISGTVGAAIEVTELKRVEEDLRNSERRLHKAETIGRAGSWEWDFVSQRGTWTPGLFRLLGIDVHESNASLASFLGLIHAADRDRVHQAVRRSIHDGVPFHTDFRLVRPDGEELMLVARGEVIRDHRNQIVRIMGTVQDVTERMRREEEIRALNARLEERVRARTVELEGAVREMEAFTYAVAHDLRAPLRALHGLGDLLLQDYSDKPLDQEGREYLHKISQASRRMDNLIQDLLSYAQLRSEEVPKEPIDLRRLAVGVVGLMTEEIRSRGARIDIEEGSAIVSANPVLLGQAVMNLLSNALKFVRPGGPPEVRLSVEPRGDRVRLSVQDNGIGIAREHVARIFGLFQRLNRLEDYPGTGIGLALVRRAVERMGGSVGVTSTPGTGSTFWIEFPLER